MYLAAILAVVFVGLVAFALMSMGASPRSTDSPSSPSKPAEPVSDLQPSTDPFEAAAHGDLEGLRTSIRAPGVSALSRVDARGWTVLHHAIAAEQTDIVRFLLAEGAPADAAAEHERTPLHLAAERDHRELVALLLRHGARALVCDEDGATPLHLTDDAEVVDALLEASVPLDLKDVHGRTALDRATGDARRRLESAGARPGTDVRMVEVLETMGADAARVPVPAHWALPESDPRWADAKQAAWAHIQTLPEPSGLVRFVLRDGDTEELVWGHLESVHPEGCRARVEEPPLHVSLPDKPIDVPRDDVHDWVRQTDRGVEGAFRQRATAAAVEEEYGRLSETWKKRAERWV